LGTEFNTPISERKAFLVLIGTVKNYEFLFRERSSWYGATSHREHAKHLILGNTMLSLYTKGTILNKFDREKRVEFSTNQSMNCYTIYIM